LHEVRFDGRQPGVARDVGHLKPVPDRGGVVVEELLHAMQRADDGALRP
jgi:hypothetical protein